MNTNATLRPARLADAEKIYALIHLHKDELVPKPMGDVVANLDRFVVAEDAGELVGCATYCVLPEIGAHDRATVEIQSVAVRAPWRHRGFGKALVENVLARVAAFGATEALLLTVSPAFFARLGFVEIPKDRVMHKLYSGCIHCTKHADPFSCPEIAMVKAL